MKLSRFGRIVILSGLTDSYLSLYDQLESHLDMPIVSSNWQTRLAPEADDLIFIEFIDDQKKIEGVIEAVELELPTASICLFGGKPDTHLPSLLKYVSLKGVLTENQIEKQTLRALKAINNQSCWFSHSQMNDLASLRKPVGIRAFESSVPLTRREKQVLDLITQGHTNQSIADRLFISLNTVKTHKNNLYRKLDSHSNSNILRQIQQSAS